MVTLTSFDEGINNLSALMIERGQFSAVYFIFLAKNMRIKKMTSLDYNN